MTNPNHEPIQYTCEYCGSNSTTIHTPDCPLAEIPVIYADGRVMSSKNRKALADLAEELRLYLSK